MKLYPSVLVELRNAIFSRSLSVRWELLYIRKVHNILYGPKRTFIKQECYHRVKKFVSDLGHLRPLVTRRKLSVYVYNIN